MSRKIISLVLSICFIFQQTGLAQAAAVELNLSGYFARMASSMDVDKFRPVHLRYFSYDSLNNSFKVLLDKGDFQRGLSPKGTDPEAKLKEETKDLLNYFLIGITLPNDKFWVNLRPDSPSQIIDFNLEETDIGKIMLEADLQLKKDTAQFTSPQSPEGKEYWNRLYKKAEEIYGTENITIPTLTRPWIVPNEIIVRETKDSAYIYKATLKVMLEQDYLKDSNTYNFKDSRAKALNEYSSQLIRELIIPKLTKEVNLSKRYAPLRQVYYSLILSRWFKSRFYGKSGVYASLIDKNDLTNLTSKDTWSKSTYFNAYKNSFADGEYNIKEPVYTPSGQTIRSYFSGGMDLTGQAASPMVLNGPRFIVGNDLAVILSKQGWLSAGAKVAVGKPIDITFTSMDAGSPVQSKKERIQELEDYIKERKRDIAELYQEISRNNEEMARLSRGSERVGTYLWSTPTNPLFTRELPNPTPQTDNLERINQNWYDQIERHNKNIAAARSELEGLKKKIAQAISALGDLHVTIYQQKSKNLVSFQLSTVEKGSNAEALSFIHDFAKEEVQKITKAYQDERISNGRVPELSKIDTHVTLVFDYPYSTTSNFLHAESLTGAIAEKINEDWRKWKQINSTVAASPIQSTTNTLRANLNDGLDKLAYPNNELLETLKIWVKSITLPFEEQMPSFSDEDTITILNAFIFAVNSIQESDMKEDATTYLEKAKESINTFITEYLRKRMYKDWLGAQKIDSIKNAALLPFKYIVANKTLFPGDWTVQKDWTALRMKQMLDAISGIVRTALNIAPGATTTQSAKPKTTSSAVTLSSSQQRDFIGAIETVYKIIEKKWEQGDNSPSIFDWDSIVSGVRTSALMSLNYLLDEIFRKYPLAEDRVPVSLHLSFTGKVTRLNKSSVNLTTEDVGLIEPWFKEAVEKVRGKIERGAYDASKDDLAILESSHNKLADILGANLSTTDDAASPIKVGNQYAMKNLPGYSIRIIGDLVWIWAVQTIPTQGQDRVICHIPKQSLDDFLKCSDLGKFQSLVAIYKVHTDRNDDTQMKAERIAILEKFSKLADTELWYMVRKILHPLILSPLIKNNKNLDLVVKIASSGEMDEIIGQYKEEFIKHILYNPENLRKWISYDVKNMTKKGLVKGNIGSLPSADLITETLALYFESRGQELIEASLNDISSILKKEISQIKRRENLSIQFSRAYRRTFRDIWLKMANSLNSYAGGRKQGLRKSILLWSSTDVPVIARRVFRGEKYIEIPLDARFKGEMISNFINEATVSASSAVGLEHKREIIRDTPVFLSQVIADFIGKTETLLNDAQRWQLREKSDGLKEQLNTAESLSIETGKEDVIEHQLDIIKTTLENINGIIASLRKERKDALTIDYNLSNAFDSIIRFISSNVEKIKDIQKSGRGLNAEIAAYPDAASSAMVVEEQPLRAVAAALLKVNDLAIDDSLKITLRITLHEAKQALEFDDERSMQRSLEKLRSLENNIKFNEVSVRIIGNVIINIESALLRVKRPTDVQGALKIDKGDQTNSSPLATTAPKTTGGIDFKGAAMASATTYETMGSFVGLDFSLPKLNSQALLSFNLDKEQSDISQAIDNGIIVSGQRIKEFMAASSVKGGLEQRRETVITWLAKLGILEETTCCTQESSKEYREALVIADSAVI